jgi:hypothetical protein
MVARKKHRPLSAMSEREREKARKEMIRLFEIAREENRRQGLLMTSREVDRYMRLLRGG